MGLELIHGLQKGLKYFLFKRIATCIESRLTIDLSILHLKEVRPEFGGFFFFFFFFTFKNNNSTIYHLLFEGVKPIDLTTPSQQSYEAGTKLSLSPLYR